MSSIFNPTNSVWPNGLKVDSENYTTFYTLGTNKVDISTVEWPVGDKLVTPFVYQNEKLVGFCDTQAMTTNSDTTIYLPYKHIEALFSAIDKGNLQIHAPKATTKKASWKNSEKEDIPEAQFKYKGCSTLDNVKAVDANYQTTDIVNGTWSEPLWDLTDGHSMFWGCENLTSFSSDLSSLTYGGYMFRDCNSLTTFSSDLSSLTNGSYMFNKCTNLASFPSDLSSLTNGFNMFYYCKNLTSFSTDLPSLTNGGSMFTGCTNLTSFTSDLSSLTSGSNMFASCKNLTSFTSDLSSLTNGVSMFFNCKLNAPSVKNIIDTINSSSETLTLGIGCDDTTEDKDLFAQEVGYADMTALLAALQTKGWTLKTQYNGRPTTTYGLRRPAEDTLPVFVKLEEAEDHADYASEDGSKKYRLNWFHETNGSTEGYTQFASLEEAIETLNIKSIERN